MNEIVEKQPAASIQPDLLERLKQRFEGKTVHRLLRFDIVELALDRAVLLMPFHADIDNGSGTVHGGFLAALADTAVACALATNFDGKMGFATSNLQIHYLRRARTDVRALAQVIKKGANTCVSTVEIRDVDNRLCALVTCEYVLTTSVLPKQGPAG
ncbi:MAG: PaaI family thioesterase [Acidobacteriota bacterium]